MSRLEKSYQKQKSLFENSKNKRISNIDKQYQEVIEKSKKLKIHAEGLLNDRAKIEKEEFISFDQFVVNSKVQQVLDKKDLNHLGDLPPEILDEVQQELRKKGFTL